MNHSAFKKQNTSIFAVLAVYVVFALCILCILISGAGIYQRLTRLGEESHIQRTCVQYVSTKVRQSSHSSLSVEPFFDLDALVLRQQIDGEFYLTRIYCHNGWLMELFSAQDAVLTPESGEKLLPLLEFVPSLQEELLTVRLVDSFQAETQLVFALRDGKEDTA